MYTAVTRDIQITVMPQYLPDQSDPDDNRFVWAYTVEVANLGRRTVQLVARHWVITDAAGKVETVSGLGVVGEQPVLNRRDGGALPHGRRQGRGVRRRDPGLLARLPAGETRAELTSPHPLSLCGKGWPREARSGEGTPEGCGLPLIRPGCAGPPSP